MNLMHNPQWFWYCDVGYRNSAWRAKKLTAKRPFQAIFLGAGNSFSKPSENAWPQVCGPYNARSVFHQWCENKLGSIHRFFGKLVVIPGSWRNHNWQLCNILKQQIGPSARLAKAGELFRTCGRFLFATRWSISLKLIVHRCWLEFLSCL